MILVTGGIASGKRTFARSLGFGEDDFSPDVDDGRSVLLDAQDLARSPEEDLEGLAVRIASCKQVVLMVDVGCGIVPVERGERAWRDDAGHLAGFIAARADAVVRMVCGIPVPVKGELPQKAADTAAGARHAREGEPCR